jgi:uncharacterized Zn finger protein
MDRTAGGPGADPTVYPRVGRVRGAAARSSTWWGKAWVRSFEESALEPSDLVTARALARSGRLGAVMVIAGMASAVLDPGSRSALMAQVRVERLADAAWAGFGAELSRESGYVAALESGDLPVELIEHADQAGVEVLPGPGDLETACECDAWAQPCLHALALLYQLAWHIDGDPYSLLLLRGRSRAGLLDAVGAAPGMLAAEADDAIRRAGEILGIADDAPIGHGLADTAVAAYDEAVSRLL